MNVHASFLATFPRIPQVPWTLTMEHSGNHSPKHLVCVHAYTLTNLTDSIYNCIIKATTSNNVRGQGYYKLWHPGENVCLGKDHGPLIVARLSFLSLLSVLVRDPSSLSIKPERILLERLHHLLELHMPSFLILLEIQILTSTITNTQLTITGGNNALSGKNGPPPRRH